MERIIFVSFSSDSSFSRALDISSFIVLGSKMLLVIEFVELLLLIDLIESEATVRFKLLVLTARLDDVTFVFANKFKLLVELELLLLLKFVCLACD
jgi:hypothetical protein